jgi:hypothetical protein
MKIEKPHKPTLLEGSTVNFFKTENPELKTKCVHMVASGERHSVFLVSDTANSVKYGNKSEIRRF